jgi:Asp-tRNA(Asn)/Glu-tRNA(Gln) amidotransferase A subunit family amidase
MSTFITKLGPASGSGTRLAVKDLIDIHGVPTTAGSRAVEQVAKPALRDAAWETDHALAAAHPDAVGQDVAQLLAMNDLFRPGLGDARAQLGRWRQSLLDLFAQVELLALPTMPVYPPRLEDLTPDSLVDIVIQITQYTGLFNAAGVPCTAQPVPAAGSRIPASLQLVGPPRGEELLLATALQIEAAMAARSDRGGRK